MDNLYRENILDHYKNPRNFGKLQNPSASLKLYNSACGDEIEMQIQFRIHPPAGGSKFIIDDIRFSGQGCAISIASASMLTEKVKGKTIEKIQNLTTKDILKMLGVSLSPSRLKCAILPLEVLQKTAALAKEKENKV
ncbi:SUF system NifU family Fe-S cluster assembly protein [Candidatus Microgenomates bacterium]|nr:SUF system NifU family Fe-S cluster assembly protein [Candidatus Microgenomates bacterium]